MQGAYLQSKLQQKIATDLLWTRERGREREMEKCKQEAKEAATMSRADKFTASEIYQMTTWA